jgi:hypothetical protein
LIVGLDPGSPLCVIYGKTLKEKSFFFKILRMLDKDVKLKEIAGFFRFDLQNRWRSLTRCAAGTT